MHWPIAFYRSNIVRFLKVSVNIRYTKNSSRTVFTILLLPHNYFSKYLTPKKPLFTKLRKCICNKLNLGSDDNLYRSFSRFDHACNTCRFDYFIIYSCNILNLKSQSCDAVINACDVLFSATAFKDFCGNSSIIIICK